MVLDRTDSLLMVPQSSVRFGGQLEIVPEQPLIIGPDDQVVTAGMQVERRDPARSRLQGLDEFLLGEVIRPNIALRCDKEDRAEGVELDTLNYSF
jgi:hypothetical protein